MVNKTSNARLIKWYRSPLSKEDFKLLHQRSDALGLAQAVGFLSAYATTLCLALYSVEHWPWWVTILLVFTHGTVAAFLINGVHELTHGTVFRTKGLNEFFAQVFGFLAVINHEQFRISHARHHRYTLHKPDDIEVMLPMHIMIWDFLRLGFFYPRTAWLSVSSMIRVSLGIFQGDLELTIFSVDAPDKRAATIQWSRIMLIGHTVLLVISIYFHLWLLPVLITFRCYGEWLAYLCNNSQHIGLQDDVPDFRLCCRTFTTNPVLQFLYWHMNYHTEHHMYAAVPCYRLGHLHRRIKHDMPPCTHGLIATWMQIAEIQMRQKKDPFYQYVALLPPTATPTQRLVSV